jgi:hypothetical protein
MSEIPARSGLVKVCATEGGSYQTLHTKSIDAGGFFAQVMGDTTRTGDTAKRQTGSGYYDVSLSCEVFYDAADAAQIIVDANNPVWVEYLPNGSTGKKCQMAYTVSAKHAPGGEILVRSYSFSPAGGAAPTDVT